MRDRQVDEGERRSATRADLAQRDRQAAEIGVRHQTGLAPAELEDGAFFIAQHDRPRARPRSG